MLFIEHLTDIEFLEKVYAIIRSTENKRNGSAFREHFCNVTRKLVFVLYECKFDFFGLWTVDQTKQATNGRRQTKI